MIIHFASQFRRVRHDITLGYGPAKHKPPPPHRVPDAAGAAEDQAAGTDPGLQTTRIILAGCP